MPKGACVIKKSFNCGTTARSKSPSIMEQQRDLEVSQYKGHAKFESPAIMERQRDLTVPELWCEVLQL
jgi:hypothetical protein